METQFDWSLFSTSEASQAVAFAIEYNDPARPAQTADGENYLNSIVVRIEPQDVLFILKATEPEIQRDLLPKRWQGAQPYPPSKRTFPPG
jgi:hypothetical protein